MEITKSTEQGRVSVAIFRITGEINVTSYEQLQTEAQQAYDGGTRNLLLDLNEVSYVSSAGIRAINHIFNLLRGSSPSESNEAMSRGIADGTFKSPHLKLLLNTNHRVREALSLAGVDMFLELHTDLQTALASF